MPDGVVQWVDTKTGHAQVVRNGRAFPARVADIEPVARHSGAHVHFDIRRAGDVEVAVRVELRPGTRVSHHQHHFGTLVGARTADAKGPSLAAAAHPELAGVAGMHPLEVARAWATSVAAGDVAGALALYAPDAEVHLAEGSICGRPALQAWLEGLEVLGCGRHPRVHGADGTAEVTWEEAVREGPALAVRSLVAHGALQQQWVTRPGAPERVVGAGGAPLSIALTTTGPVADKDVALANAQVLGLVEKLDEPVLFARLKLSWEPDPARQRPARAQVSLDVDGELVRAHVAAPTMPEAIELLEQRLRDRLEHVAQRREHDRRMTGEAEPGEWRHGDLPTSRPPYFDRPVEDRQLVRHKTFAVDECTPDEAVFDMEQLDYDFYLFRDLATGVDSLVERTEDGYRMTRLVPSDITPGPTAVPLSVSPAPVPTLALDDAVERLDAGSEPFVFFASASTGRGNVVYRRYDGHYGLISPE